MNWEKEKADWPFAEHSRFVTHGPHRWHVVTVGDPSKPRLLLLHGAGASSHSWAPLLPALCQRFHCVAVDLPGHGFTRRGGVMRGKLPNVAHDLHQMLRAERLLPDLVLGHSAGVAVALQLTFEVPLKGIVGLNGALAEFEGVAGWLFPVMAKVLALNPLTALVFSQTATPKNVTQMIEATGSTLSEDRLSPYYRLVRNRAHVDGTLSMMAEWDLRPLIQRMNEVRVPVLLLSGDLDKAVAPETSALAAQRLARARHRTLSGLGHLMHEEDPDRVAAEILPFFQACLDEVATQPLAQGA